MYDDRVWPLVFRHSNEELFGFGSTPFCPNGLIARLEVDSSLTQTWEEGQVEIRPSVSVRAFRGQIQRQVEYTCADETRRLINLTESRLRTFGGWTPSPDTHCGGQDLTEMIEYRNASGTLLLTETSRMLSVPSP